MVTTTASFGFPEPSPRATVRIVLADGTELEATATVASGLIQSGHAKRAEPVEAAVLDPEPLERAVVPRPRKRRS